jgi:hypothetical protein
MLRRLAPPLVLVALGLLFFGELLLHPTAALYADHSDMLAYHVPVKRYLVRTYQETGELPLWCPYSYGGMPFVHDIQAAAFYPPHLPLYWMSEAAIGCALSWLVVFHVIAAGLCMYAYARAGGLRVSGALVAAIGYMFAGKWMFHLLAAGHTNVAPLAWLPLVLLLLEGAHRRGSAARAAAAGAVFALIVLGTHPQFTFYAGLFVALWLLGPALEQAGYLGAGGTRSWRRTAGAMGRWAAFGAVAGAVALGLSAVQLLPTLEAAAHTGRAAGGPILWSRDGTMDSLRWLVGPAQMHYGWETHTGLGVTWLMAAVLAVVSGGGRVRFQAAVGLAPVAVALGGWFLLQRLPGFRLFDTPPRILILTALPVALLAGTATDRLFTATQRPDWLGPAAQLALWAPVLGLLLLAWQILGQGPRIPAYWAAAGVAALALVSLLSRFSGAPGLAWKLAFGATLCLESWALAWPLVDVRPDAELFAPSEAAAFLAAHAAGHERLLDRDLPDAEGESPVGTAQPLLLGLQTVRGYNPLDVHRSMQYLHFISDVDDEAPPHRAVPNFPIRNKALLDLLGVRYLVQPEGVPPETGGWKPVATDGGACAFCFVPGGMRRLPAYRVYENDEVLPRAFVVHEAGALPERARALAALKGTDFRHKVLLDGVSPAEVGGSPGGEPRPATICEYRPNRVVVDVESDAPGYLVLTDVWFPGWAATVDGRPSAVLRADYLFRAVAVPAGRSQVVFAFEPLSYRWGRWISVVTAGGLALAAWCLRRVALPRER